MNVVKIMQNAYFLVKVNKTIYNKKVVSYSVLLVM